MQINLRKATKLRGELENKVRALGQEAVVATNRSVSVHEPDLNAIVAECDTTLSEKLEDLSQAQAILVNLRKAIGRANQNSGVSDLLAEQASANQVLETLNTLIRRGKRQNMDVLESQRKVAVNQLNSPNAYYNAEQNISINGLGLEMFDALNTQIKQVKSKVRKLEDEILAKNLTTEISLNAETVKKLDSLGIEL